MKVDRNSFIFPLTHLLLTPDETKRHISGISREIMGFNGIIWDENESQGYPQVFIESN
jgi:hypothetical protein